MWARFCARLLCGLWETGRFELLIVGYVGPSFLPRARSRGEENPLLWIPELGPPLPSFGCLALRTAYIGVANVRAMS